MWDKDNNPRINLGLTLSHVWFEVLVNPGIILYPNTSTKIVGLLSHIEGGIYLLILSGIPDDPYIFR